MAYDYIRKYYGMNPVVGEEVLFENKRGRIAPVKGDSQYVMVKFRGADHAVPVHPTSIEYLDQP